ncbi:hypothetical protein HOY80DRAFT_1068789 [Tuber brumale]|nr:hypothetical protein HOY80DRAFT_1068789 [Tuber brumale]
MATQILQVIKETLETRNHELLVFTELDPKVSSEILDNLLDPLQSHLAVPDLDNPDTSLSPPDGYLKVMMPTALHETAVRWMVDKLVFWGYDHILTRAAICAVGCGLITCDNFVGDFEGSSKTPDLSYNPRINGIMTEFPTVVLESGWAESGVQLLRDLQLWEEGSAGAVRIVILCKAFRPGITNEIKATLKIVEKDITGDHCDPCHSLRT